VRGWLLHQENIGGPVIISMQGYLKEALSSSTIFILHWVSKRRNEPLCIESYLGMLLLQIKYMPCELLYRREHHSEMSDSGSKSNKSSRAVSARHVEGGHQKERVKGY
ncbi:MAG: hypothetical protein OEY07_18050, partial [Gammaproteobacteria bacterium]|nr:hypothetical protein [Gammaproteobacteria bacterium]